MQSASHSARHMRVNSTGQLKLDNPHSAGSTPSFAAPRRFSVECVTTIEQLRLREPRSNHLDVAEHRTHELVVLDREAELLLARRSRCAEDADCL